MRIHPLFFVEPNLIVRRNFHIIFSANSQAFQYIARARCTKFARLLCSVLKINIFKS